MWADVAAAGPARAGSRGDLPRHASDGIAVIVVSAAHCLTTMFGSARLACDGSRGAVVVYAAAWLGAAAVIVGLLLIVLAGEEPEAVLVPPVHEMQLGEAAREAGCELRRARPGERLNPPVVGGIGALPARPGFYDESPGASALVAAQREGVIVIQFRGLDASGIELLRTVQAAIPVGTIVAPNETRMPFAVAVTSYRRLLGCRDLSAASVDAIQLFRGRFVGYGPDR